LEVIRRGSELFEKKGVESPRLQMELLLAHVLKLKRMGLYLNFERDLTPGELEEIRGLTLRRAAHEPLQHLIGSSSFCGLEIAVNRDVLIPRPETEVLAELGWKFLRDLAKTSESVQALDFGTGSGCVAIALAVHCRAARVTAVDISAKALAVARENAGRHRVAIEFCEGDGFQPLVSGSEFDLIAGNPPYVTSGEIESLDPEVRCHDPRLALDGGEDGLIFYRRLAREAGAYLKDGGRIMLEFGDGQESALPGIFEAENWVVEAIVKDYSGRPRIMPARKASV